MVWSNCNGENGNSAKTQKVVRKGQAIQCAHYCDGTTDIERLNEHDPEERFNMSK